MTEAVTSAYYMAVQDRSPLPAPGRLTPAQFHALQKKCYCPYGHYTGGKKGNCACGVRKFSRKLRRSKLFK